MEWRKREKGRQGEGGDGKGREGKGEEKGREGKVPPFMDPRFALIDV